MLADFVEKNKFNVEINVTVREPWELDRCRESWAGFEDYIFCLKYKCVTVNGVRP